jgi:histidinol-phosphate aminotransferase
LTQASANFLLKEKECIANNAKIIMNERSRLFDELSLIPELAVYPSQTNFLLIKADNAQSLCGSLKSNGVLVKGFVVDSELENFIRISVSESKENNILLKHIKEYYG